jgi:putative transposase
MLSNEAVLSLLDRLGTSPKAKNLVLEARIKAPVREVASRGGNVITVIASRKMQRQISTESRHIEFQAALRYEYDPLVLEYYPQPCELKLEVIDEVTGEIHKVQHFPDFLLLRADRVELVEWKSQAKLERLAERYPWRYSRDKEGRWAAPGIERQLAERGIIYRICTDADLHPRWSENMLALEDYLHPGAEPCLPDVLEKIRAALREEPYLFLADLYADPYGFKPDQILKAIADRELVADLYRDDLTKPRLSKIFRDEAVLELLTGYDAKQSAGEVRSYQFPVAPGVAFSFDGQRFVIAIVGEKNLVLSDASGGQTEVTHDWLHRMHVEKRVVPESHILPQTQESLARYSETELQLALQRQKFLERADGPSERTKRRWRQRQLAAELHSNNEVLALVPRTRDRGNRAPRLSAEQEGAMARVIQTKWLTPEASNCRACYKFLKTACADAGLDLPSYPTFVERIKAQDVTKSNRARYGKRRAYQEDEFVYSLNVDTPIHGSRPFQYCHIDHTELDIELICSRTGKNLGRPWVSLAVDSFTRQVLGIYLTFDCPSYVATMMVLRDIVRRHHRLPQFIVADNGADFRSVNFENLLEALGSHLRFRPSGQPRHGSVLERMFGRAHSEYVHNLAGNTKATKEVRTTTGKFLPKNLAEWSLEAMYYGLENWAFEYYDQEVHRTLGMSPREFYEKGIAESGARAHTHLICNTDFLIATCPSVDREGVRTVNRQRGVKFHDFYYWAPEFRDLKLAGRKVRVRYDPWDASTAYAEVNKTWVRCVCNTLAGLSQMTDSERKALSEEYRRRNGVKPDSAISMQRLREFLQTYTPDGAMALHRARQAENKNLYVGMNQAWVQPPVATPSHGFSSLPGTPERAAHQQTSLPPGTDIELPEYDTF